MRRGTPVALVIAVLALAGCSAEPSAAPDPEPAPSPTAAPAGGCQVPERGTSAHTLSVAGDDRRFVVDVPDDFGGQRMPVVYMIHGLGGEATRALAYTAFGAYGQEHGFITVAPQALGEPARWDFGTGPDVDGSDFDFLEQLTDHIVTTWCGQSERQYLTGFSNGSAMTFAAACFGGLDFAAYGSVAAAGYLPERCAEAPPASIIYAHGTADPVVPFEGGDTVLDRVAPAPQTMGQWAAHDGCGPPSEDQVADDVSLLTWEDCSAGARLAFYVIDGGGHHWPGGAVTPSLGRASGSIDITALMVEFFGLSSAAAG